MPMSHQQALDVLARQRGTKVVITTMTAVGLWPAISDTPLDFAYLPSAMGHVTGIALGLALAQPGRGIIVVNGDGSLLMNLGCLVTLAQNPADVYVLIMDNALYEVTGGQPIPGAGRVDYAQLARGAGIERVYQFETLQAWQDGAAEALTGPGPVVAWLRVEGRLGQKTPKAPRPMSDQIRRLRSALGVSG